MYNVYKEKKNINKNNNNNSNNNNNNNNKQLTNEPTNLTNHPIIVTITTTMKWQIFNDI